MVETEARQRTQRAIEDQRQAMEREGEARQRLLERPFINAIEGIQGAFTDGFEKIFSGGVDTFSDLASVVKKIMIRLAAEMAALLIFRPVIGPVVGGTAGSVLRTAEGR